MENFDLDDVFTSASVMQGSRGRTGLAQVVMTLSGSGSPGKTTLALALAERAATRGKRVILVDGNIATPDITGFLGISAAGLPTVYDGVALAKGSAKAALISPKTLQSARDARLQPVNFALVQAPTVDELRMGRVDTTDLADIVDQCRELADLVVIDCPNIEPDDPRHLLTSLVLPLLGRGAWALTSTALSSANVRNLLGLLEILHKEGAPAARILSVLSRVRPDVAMNRDRLTEAFKQRSVHLGTIWDDSRVLVAMNRGEPLGDQPALAVTADQVLELCLDMEPTAVPYDPHAKPAKNPLKRWRR